MKRCTEWLGVVGVELAFAFGAFPFQLGITTQAVGRPALSQSK